MFLDLFVPFRRSLARRATRTVFARDPQTGSENSKNSSRLLLYNKLLKKGQRNTFGVFASNCSISSEDSASSTASEREDEWDKRQPKDPSKLELFNKVHH